MAQNKTEGNNGQIIAELKSANELLLMDCDHDDQWFKDDE